LSDIESLSQVEFELLLKKMYPGVTLYRKCWINYPRSTFYYDHSDFDGSSANIGIYTAPTIYGLGPS